MRLFISIPTPEYLQEYFVNLQQPFRHHDLNITSKNQFHITLKFLGDTEPENVHSYLMHIKEKPFNLTLTTYGVFPSPQFARVLWIGTTPELNPLQKKIDIALEPLFPKEEKFHSHITLGRFKKPPYAGELLKDLQRPVEQHTFPVTQFHLMKSILSSQGSKYTIVNEYTLE